MDRLEVLQCVSFVSAVASLEELSKTKDGVHRCTNIVTHISEELTFCLIRRLCFVPRLPEFDLVLLELGDVVEADENACGFAFRPQDRRAIDDECAPPRFG